jgi:hypothetical protein
MSKLLTRLFLSAAMLLPLSATAAQLVVIDSYGTGMKPGTVVDGSKPINLTEGQKLTLIGPDGRSVTLVGKFSGLALAETTLASDPKQALAALITTRNARANTIAAIRSGSTAAVLPDPWLIDISRPGQRCVREGEPQVWWRPATDITEDFMVFPLDKSWTASLSWDEGDDRMEAPQLWRFDTESLYIVKTGPQEDAITVNIIPSSVKGELMMTAWMLEKGCTQQADAFLRRIGEEQGGDKVATMVSN